MNRLITFVAPVGALLIMLPSMLSAAEVTPSTPAARPGQRGIVNRVGWIGFAVSPDRRAFQSDAQVGSNAETIARNEARNECELATGQKCRAISVVESADVSAVGCTYKGHSGAFLGGSTSGKERQIALNKAKK